MKKRTVWFAFLTLGLSVSACKKEDEKVGETPVIKILSVSPGTAKATSDAITLTLEYEDGDGDLGENSNTAQNVYVTDTRNNIVRKLRLSQLGPDDTKTHIKGKVSIVINPIGLINDANASESATLTVQVFDRAGHASNVAETSLTVIKD